jgi:hexosaminidase
MSPGTHCYFDHYQSSPTDEPLAIGGFTPLEKVYAFEPVPAELSKEEESYILGAQANVWTEYILNEKHVEYMAMPRMAALAEVLWTPKELKNETNFLERLQKHFLLLDQLDVNYAKALYNVKYTITPNKNTQRLELDLNANSFLGSVYYTLDGSMPTMNSLKYLVPIELKTNTTVKAGLFKNNELKGRVSSREYNINKATNKLVTFQTPPSKYYNTGGAFTLVNSVVATLPRVNDQWLGWSGQDIEAVVDLGKEEDIQLIQIGFLNEELNWIYLPQSVEFFISNDGIQYSSIQKQFTKEFKDERFAEISFISKKARYVKIKAKTFGKIESGKPGAGEDAWLFCDEIIIN